MMRTIQFQKGDKVGIRNGCYAVRVAKISGAEAHAYYVSDGGKTWSFETVEPFNGIGRWNSNLKLDSDWQSVERELAEAKAKADAERKAHEEFSATPEYRLALSMIDTTGCTDIAGQFARLGMDKLRQIEAWMKECPKPNKE